MDWPSEGGLLKAEEVESRKTGDEKKEVKDVILHVFSHPSAGVEVTVDLLRRADAPATPQIEGCMSQEDSQSFI